MQQKIDSCGHAGNCNVFQLSYMKLMMMMMFKIQRDRKTEPVAVKKRRGANKQKPGRAKVRKRDEDPERRKVRKSQKKEEQGWMRKNNSK